MRISSVTAHAFGPFAGRTLELADGMTVIVGDNESGKSSWHAAIYAALCGRKRGRGAATIADRRFEERHRPWSGDKWLVTALLSLDDGRSIEMRQDLAGKVDCSATEATTGRDVSSEIMFDGSPDATRWLGLDRSTFVSTACVGQASLLGVRDEAEGLQSYLQAAATSAKAGGTAAGAIDLIKDFHKEKVGTEGKNAVKPLRRALDALAVAEHALQKANADHHEYLERVELAEVAGIERATAERDLRAGEAVVAADKANRLSAAAQRAAQLDAACGGIAPAPRADADALDEQVLRALADYDRRPAEPAAVVPTVADLDAQLAELPLLPEGDLSPDPAVVTAIGDLRRAQMAQETFLATRPPAPAASLPAASESELLELAHTLSSPPAEVDAELTSRLTRAQAEAAPRPGGRRTPFLIVGAALAAIGVALLAMGQPIVGAALVVGGAMAVGIGLVPRRVASTPAATAELARAEAALQAAQAAAAQSRRSYDAAITRCTELGVQPTATHLRSLAVAVANAAEQRGRAADFAIRSADLAAALDRTAAAARTALTARGCHVGESVVDPAALFAAADEYVSGCTERAGVAAVAAGRATLAARIEAAEQAQERAAADRAARERATAELLAAALACGLSNDDETAARAALGAWQRDRAATRDAADAVRDQWAELQLLLHGRSVADLQAEADRARQHAGLLAVDTASSVGLEPADAEQQLPALRHAAEAAREEATRALTAASELAARIGSVAEAEEAVSAAEAELARVRGLGAILTRTQKFLEDAEADVHRTIAPLLNESLNARLASVTAGRYTEARVDPEHLAVTVCGADRDWRPAEHLSFGTSEQIYLLLRAALVDHLTNGRDTCPLILDDVTVHADADRKVQILELLHELSKDRQVIVFTQEQQVADWAREHLTADRDAIRELEPIPA